MRPARVWSRTPPRCAPRSSAAGCSAWRASRERRSPCATSGATTRPPTATPNANASSAPRAKPRRSRPTALGGVANGAKDSVFGDGAEAVAPSGALPPGMRTSPEPGSAQGRAPGPRATPRAGSSSATWAPMPREAVRPVERMAATVIMRAGRRGADAVVGVAARGPQPGVGAHGLKAVEGRKAGDGLVEDLADGVGADGPVGLVFQVDGGGSGDDLAVDGGEDEDALGARCGDGQQDAVEGRPAREVKTKNSPLRG